MTTAWSGLAVEASNVSSPFCSTRTRAAPWPRITGRPAPGPKSELATPGVRASVSPSVGARRRSRSSPVSTVDPSTSSSCVLFRGAISTTTGCSVTGSACWAAREDAENGTAISASRLTPVRRLWIFIGKCP